MQDQPLVDESTPVLHETPEELAFELRSHEGAMWTGGRLFIGIWGFTFASLAFTYFYLRSANNDALWRPGHVTAPTATGAAIFSITLTAAGLVVLGWRRFTSGTMLDWRVAGWIAVLAALVVTGLQIWQLTQLPFFPGSSGYASCFIGWASLNIALILCATYWLETNLAREHRLRRDMATDGGIATSSSPTARLFRVSMEGCAYFWGFTALVGTLFWVLYYVL